MGIIRKPKARKTRKELDFFLALRSSPSSGRGERGCAIAVTNPFCITVILVIMSSLHFLYRLKRIVIDFFVNKSKRKLLYDSVPNGFLFGSGNENICSDAAEKCA